VRRPSRCTRSDRQAAWISAEADVFLGSVQVPDETGEVLGAKAGQGQGLSVCGSPKGLWFAGIDKLVPRPKDGIRRT